MRQDLQRHLRAMHLCGLWSCECDPKRSCGGASFWRAFCWQRQYGQLYWNGMRGENLENLNTVGAGYQEPLKGQLSFC